MNARRCICLGSDQSPHDTSGTTGGASIAPICVPIFQSSARASYGSLDVPFCIGNPPMTWQDWFRLLEDPPLEAVMLRQDTALNTF